MTISYIHMGIRYKNKWHFLTLFQWITIFGANNCNINKTRVVYVLYRLYDIER